MKKRRIRTLSRIVSAATTSRAARALVLVTAVGILAACDDGDVTPTVPQGNLGSAAPAAPAAPTPANVLRVTDVTGKPIAGAVVTAVGDTPAGQTTTGDDGRASLADFPTGQVTLSVSAEGFETRRFTARLPVWVDGLSLPAVGAWAIGRAIVLGTRMVELAADGSTLTFSVDVVVIGSSSAAIETLTSNDIAVLPIDCGWGGPRDCASDSAGNATARGGVFAPDGPARSFGLQPPAARRPYRVGVLAERSKAVRDWDVTRMALKEFFATLGGNDAASLALVETSGQATMLSTLGPYTSDGRTYLETIDGLADSSSEPPVMLDSILESIRQAAAASSDAQTNAEATVLVLATPWMTVADINDVVALARQLGVRISAVVRDNFGLPEMAVRTGGFVTEYSDPRQLELIFGAMDPLLAGTLPYYRMEFRVRGVAGTFVSGGNAKVRLRIRVPTSLPNDGVFVTFDVAIE